MANTTIGLLEENTGLNLLGSLTRVEVPFIKVKIGDYTFGVWDSEAGAEGVPFSFPKYIKSINIKKINGQVNTYELYIDYPITDTSDPNFFEKVFSSVSQTRKIVFSYGDMSMPSFIYRNEEAIITNVTTAFRATSSVISYTVSAVSSANLLTAGSCNFERRYCKPSTVIIEMLKNNIGGITDVFYGMRNIGYTLSKNIISIDDSYVNIPAKNNISVLEYLSYLVTCMTPQNDSKANAIGSGIYVLNIVDDITGTFDGPYFTIKKLQTGETNSNLGTYTIDMGYPSQNIVTDFSIVNNEVYSIYYNFQNSVNDNNYRYQIDNKGKMTQVFAPSISSKNNTYETTEADRSWWTAVTEYPVQASITLKGLLRPALLMSYVRLNMYYFGKKHISSGLYAITKQEDKIDATGYKTTLSLVRVGGDTDTSNVYFTGDSFYDSNNISDKSGNIYGLNSSYSVVNTGTGAK